MQLDGLMMVRRRIVPVLATLTLAACAQSSEGEPPRAAIEAPAVAQQEADDDWEALSQAEIEALANVAPAAGPDSAGAKPEIAVQVVQRLSRDAIAMLADPRLPDGQRTAAFRGLLLRDFDVAAIGRIVLGRYWRQATPAQQAEYQRLFQDFIVAIYASRLGKYSGETLRVTTARSGKRDIIVVKSLIQSPGKAPVQVDWLVRSAGGAQRIIDVVVEGVSMAITQRSEFASIIQSNGGKVEGLLAALRARTT
jgi:phospholipid transport system substrate-binding protein